MLNLKKEPIIIADTKNEKFRATTFMITVPTCLVAELRTHRILSQLTEVQYEGQELNELNMSANSDRAIPVSRRLKDVLENPYVPIFTGANPGMQGKFDLPTETRRKAEELHLHQLGKQGFVLYLFEEFEKLGIHKQVANRHLMPWAWSTVILTGTEWENFFDLRCPKYMVDGHVYRTRRELFINRPEYQMLDDIELYRINHSMTEPAFMRIAEIMKELYDQSTPKEKGYHVPFEDFIDNELSRDIEEFSKTHQVSEDDVRMMIGASLCAKSSYDTQERKDTLNKHLTRTVGLATEKHMEPFSHCLQAMTKEQLISGFNRSYVKEDDYGNMYNYVENGWCYNVRGFVSMRYKLENFKSIHKLIEKIKNVCN